MPKYFDFVLAAYSIWIGVFAIYLLMLFRRSRRNRAALELLLESPLEPQSRGNLRPDKNL